MKTYESLNPSNAPIIINDLEVKDPNVNGETQNIDTFNEKIKQIALDILVEKIASKVLAYLQIKKIILRSLSSEPEALEKKINSATHELQGYSQDEKEAAFGLLHLYLNQVKL